MRLDSKTLPFRSLRHRILKPLLILTAIAICSGVFGVYWLTNAALKENLFQRGQVLSTTLIVSAETSSSLADFQRAVLAIASEPSIERILLSTSDFQPIFSGDIFKINSYQEEFSHLSELIQQAKKTGLSVGSTDPNHKNTYHIVSLIHISALPQSNILTPEPSLLLVSLDTEQARSEALIGALGMTALFISIGVIAFISIYILLNDLVLRPSQRIVSVMKSQKLKQDDKTGFTPIHELGLIGQTLDQLSLTLNAREQALETALIKAQEANNAKSQFLASMSHEIRTPMNGVIGMLHLLNKETLNEKQQHYIDIAKSSADSLLSLINDILDVSKIEAGKLSIENIDFDIRLLFDDLTLAMSHRIQNQNVKLTLNTENIKTQFVQGDPGRIRQVVTNLIGNAIKFTQQGDINILVSTEYLENKILANPKLLLQCDIIDTGIGIPADKLDQLFDSFTQADTSTTRVYGGTGLGLTIAKQLCQLMGGDIQVTSEHHKGSHFSFTANLTASNKNISAFAENSRVKDADLKLNKNSEPKVLLVEDNEINQLVALGILENLGINAESANHGQEAIDILLENPNGYYSLILMDCQMPVMDGYTTTQNIRHGNAGDEYRTIPIVAMTANAMQGDREKCLSAGMDDYLTKPIDDKILLTCLSNHLSAENITAEKSEVINSTGTSLNETEIFIWDQKALLQRLGNNEHIMLKVLRSFIQDMPDLINQIEEQNKSPENNNIDQVLHTIKGVAANINATELYNLSIELERQYKNNLWDEDNNAWPEFKVSYQRLIEKITSVVNSL